MPESAFEAEVGEFLQSQGFHVNCQVGESGFRIDLGVKRGKDDTRYICGIECDGRRYHSGWRVRLNDIWRQEILVRKGWRIHRIWSNEWFGNPKYVQAELLKKLPPSV
jgi:very-short-patch-repair endonuclease